MPIILFAILIIYLLRVVTRPDDRTINNVGNRKIEQSDNCNNIYKNISIVFFRTHFYVEYLIGLNTS